VRKGSDSGATRSGDDREQKELNSPHLLDLKRLASTSQGGQGDGVESSCRGIVLASGGWEGWCVAAKAAV